MIHKILPGPIQGRADGWLQDSSLPTLAGDQTFSGLNTFTGTRIDLTHATPTLRVTESDGAVDNKIWELLASAEAFIIRTQNDAISASEILLQADRTAQAIDTVNFPNGELQSASNKVWHAGNTTGIEVVSTAEQTITLNTTLSVSHGKSVEPFLTVAQLICKTAEDGYSIDDRITLVSDAGHGGTNVGSMVGADNTNFFIVWHPTNIQVRHKGTRSDATLTVGNWRVIIRGFFTVT